MLTNQIFWKKVLKQYRRKRLYPAIYERVFPFLRGSKYLMYNPASKFISIHYPEYVEPDKDELGIVKRIFHVFKRMKEDQKKAPDYYLPSSLWQTNLNEAYFYLISGAEENDITKFHYFLANFLVHGRNIMVSSIIS